MGRYILLSLMFAVVRFAVKYLLWRVFCAFGKFVLLGLGVLFCLWMLGFFGAPR